MLRPIRNRLRLRVETIQCRRRTHRETIHIRRLRWSMMLLPPIQERRRSSSCGMDRLSIQSCGRTIAPPLHRRRFSPWSRIEDRCLPNLLRNRLLNHRLHHPVVLCLRLLPVVRQYPWRPLPLPRRRLLRCLRPPPLKRLLERRSLSSSCRQNTTRR